MDIANAQQAREFIAAWEGRPRPGILSAAIDGLRMARGIANARVYSDETRKNYDEAIDVLVAVQNPRLRVEYLDDKGDPDLPFETTFREMIEDNCDDDEVCSALRGLRSGQSVTFGGGAAPVVRVTNIEMGA